MINQINKLTLRIYSNLTHKKIHYYLKLQIPKMHRLFFKTLSQNPQYVQTHCRNLNNPFRCLSQHRIKINTNKNKLLL